MALARYFIIVPALLLSWINLYSQEINLTANGIPLNKVLVEIRDQYGVQFSFDDAELSKYKITVSGSFRDIDQTLKTLLRKIPFEFQRISGVYVIYKKNDSPVVEKEPSKVFRISGKVLEKNSEEFLPYTQLIINSLGIMSDGNGNFAYHSTTDSIFRIRVSQLGYHTKDTVFYHGRNHVRIFLIPSDQLINEITVNENLLENFYQSSNEPGTISLNHKISKYLPGSSDNSAFNLLRLQPGILASGEQTNDLIIWGSYAGQSRTYFDGITLFGLKNFNDNIGVINPLIIKNIQIRKAGYNASWGDCVGGIVDISGKEGNSRLVKFNTGINNFTLNSLLEIPVIKKSSLQLAYRQTFYNLYRNGLNLFPRLDAGAYPVLSDIKIFPDYRFRDLNIKYSVKTNNNLFYISYLNGRDRFDYALSESRQYRNIVKTTNEENVQNGLSLYLDQRISQNINAVVNVSHSSLTSWINDKYEIYSSLTGKLVNQKEIGASNKIAETKAVLKTTYLSHKNNTFEIEVQALNNHTLFTNDSSGTSLAEIQNNCPYYTLALKEILRFPHIYFDFGIRASFVPYLKNSFLEPRFSFTHQLSEKFRYHFAWGKYYQFLVKSAEIDDLGNYRYFWTVADDQNIPLLESYHYVTGLSYLSGRFMVNLDAFYKSTMGISRYIRLQPLNPQTFYKGMNKSYGIDLYTKYNQDRFTLWISYTLSKSLEHFSYFKNDAFLYAPQDQRHELKLATIIDFSPVFLSVDYIYGSGFLEKPFQQAINSERIPYSRLDLAVSYKFSIRQISGECGISILNLLNTENRKFSNFERVPVSLTNSVGIYFEAVPFMPSVFLKFSI